MREIDDYENSISEIIITSFKKDFLDKMCEFLNKEIMDKEKEYFHVIDSILLELGNQ